MTWIFISVLALILITAGLVTWFYMRWKREEFEKQGRDTSELMPAGVGLAAVAFVVILWVVITAAMSVKTVGEREVGIVYNFTGTIAGKKEKGWVTIAPWQHMDKENVGILHQEFLFGADNSAVSKDQQDIFANLAINYQIDGEKVLDLYRRVGPSWKTTIIESRVPQVFKEVTSTFQTPRITEERVALREQTRQRLTEELEPYDIKVVDVFITNLGFSELYSQAIEQKQKQVQDALQAEAKVKQVQAEARQKVAEAKGEAQANRLRSKSLTPQILRLRAIETLNDNVQIIVCPPQSVCIPNSGVIPNPVGP